MGRVWGGKTSLLAMIDLWPGHLFEIAEALSELEGKARRGTPTTVLSREARLTFVTNTLEPARSHCEEAGLSVSLQAVDEFIHALARDNGLTVEGLARHIGILRAAIRYELKSLEVYQVDKGRQQFLSVNVFGGVADSFPSLAFDISQANRAFAYELNTACVFHLMRIMEAGLREIGRYVGVNLKSRSDWDVVLVQSEARIQNGTAPKKKFLIDATAQLRAVKRAWRNDVMHVGSEYTDEHAREIYGAVKAFMRHLSTEIREPLVPGRVQGIAPPPVDLT